MVNIGGKKINNWWLIGGAGAAIGVWYLYKRSAASSSSSADSTDSSAIDPVTGLPYSEDDSIDPITGMTYLQEAQEYGSVTAAEQEITSGSAYYGDTGTTGVDDSGYPTIDGVTDGSAITGQTFATNAAWSQAVTAGLVDLGYSAQDVAAALGLYFQSQPLGSGADGVSYASIIQAAIAEYGPPPVGSFPITTAPSTTGSTTTTGGGGTTTSGGGGTTTGGGGGGSGGGTGTADVAVPNVVGDTVNAAHTKLKAAGLSYNTDTAKDEPGYDRIVTAENPKAGTKVAPNTHVGLTWHYVKQ